MIKFLNGLYVVYKVLVSIKCECRKDITHFDAIVFLSLATLPIDLCFYLCLPLFLVAIIMYALSYVLV